jgi:hypothetical protein
MPQYKFTGQNESGYVVFGGTRFNAGEPVEVNDPLLQKKLDSNGEFERVDNPQLAGDLGPVIGPPGPTGVGTGPGTGPYQTTNEVVDANPVEGAGQKTPEELAAEQEEEPPPEPDPGPEADPFVFEEPPTTEEGPKKKKR